MGMIDKKEIRKMLVRTERARKSVLQPYFAEIGLPLGQGHVRILESLLAADHITQKELADRCHVDVTTMSRSLLGLLDRLEEAGFLERRRDPGNRRSFLVCLTQSGVEEAHKVLEILAELDERICRDFDDAQMDQLYRSLEKICRNLES